MSPLAASAPDDTPKARARGRATAVHVIPASRSHLKEFRL